LVLEFSDTLYGKNAVEFAINSMEMGDAMFALAEIHLDNDAIKMGNDWHMLSPLL
jgi:hypothetical protein